MVERDYKKATRPIIITGYILAVLTFILEVIIPRLEFTITDQLKDSAWVFRWIILSNILNSSILILENILIRVFSSHKSFQCYIISFSLVSICAVIACQHYYFTQTQIIFVIPILLTVPVMIKKLNLMVSMLSFIGLMGSFYLRSLDPTAERNLWSDFVICIVFIIIVELLSYTLVEYLMRQTQLMEKSKDEAVRASRAKSDFLLNMSHEIRTPINSILGMNEMILRECKDENISRYAENINNSSQTLLSLINDILDLSKIEAGKIEIISDEFNLEKLIRETVSMVRERIEKKNLKLEIKVDENLPAGLWGDSSRIREILLNFLTNAAKYTREGKVLYSISGTRSADCMEMIYSVKDTGIGIRDEDLKKIFGRFERFDIEQNRNIEGTGIGLRIAKQLANLMGGEIEVKSTYGEGSEFIFRIRQNIMDFEPIGKIDFNKSVGTKSKKYSVLFKAPDAKILVVDDIDINLFVIENLLKQTDMKVILAQSGDECIKICQNEKFDLILIDHMMPNMNGMETFDHLRKDEKGLNKETPCVMLTANAFNGAREIYEKAGFIDYITKPIECERLEGVVSRVLPQDKVTYSL